MRFWDGDQWTANSSVPPVPPRYRTRKSRAWIGWVVAGVVVVGWIASLSDDDTATESPGDSQPTASVDREESADGEDAETDIVAEDEAAPGEETKPQAEKTYRVSSVTDGDTLDLANGDSVRLVGIDAPENGACGSVKATELLSQLALGQRVTLTAPVRDLDRYGRLLRYVDVGATDAGLELISSGLAIARYDSRDGYERHAREKRYIKRDLATPDISCAPVPLVTVPDEDPPQPNGGSCAPGYSPCIPAYPPDLDCADTGPVSVTGSDPHGLDADGDGLACGGD